MTFICVIWTKSSGPCGAVHLLCPTEAAHYYHGKAGKGKEELHSKIWTLPSTPVFSWNPLNQFLFAKLIEKVKKFCSRLRNRMPVLPGGRLGTVLMKMPFKRKKSHLPLWQSGDCSQNYISAQTFGQFPAQKGNATSLMRSPPLEKLSSTAQRSQVSVKQRAHWLSATVLIQLEEEDKLLLSSAEDT